MQLKDEELKQSELDRMRGIATGLLALATAVFIVARIYEDAAPWVGFVRATAEAAMVGAIADWFAVTALFRYPLGIRIPHTAIVPNRKDQIGRSLGRFVENNFLSHQVLTSKLRSLDVAARLGEWLQDPEQSHRLGGHLAKGLAGAVQVLRDEDVERLIERGLSARIRETEVAPLMGNVLGMVASSDLRRELLDGALGLISNLVEENRGDLRERIDREIPWWVPKPIDDKIYRRIIESVERLLDELRGDPDHPLRRRFDEILFRFVEELKTSPEMIARGEEIKEELLEHAGVRRFSARLWGELRESLVAHSADPASDLRVPLDQGIRRFGEALLADDVLRGKINGWAERALVTTAETYRHEVGGLISYTVQQWDPEETSRKIELQVGRDLQFIRINGTLVGGLAGLLIHVLSRLL